MLKEYFTEPGLAPRRARARFVLGCDCSRYGLPLRVGGTRPADRAHRSRRHAANGQALYAATSPLRAKPRSTRSQVTGFSIAARTPPARAWQARATSWLNCKRISEETDPVNALRPSGEERVRIEIVEPPARPFRASRRSPSRYESGGQDRDSSATGPIRPICQPLYYARAHRGRGTKAIEYT